MSYYQLMALQGPMTPDLLDKLIGEHGSDALRYRNNYDLYKGTVPILNRVMPDTNKANNKLANDYHGELIDQVVAYMAGNPITYQYDGETDLIKDFNFVNSIEELDARTIKFSSVCGTVFRLPYIDNKARVRLILCMPWTIIPIYVDDVIVMFIRYWSDQQVVGDKTLAITKAEVYTATSVTKWIKRDTGAFEVEVAETRHAFSQAPLIEFMNNDERTGDTEKVATLIDAYDSTLSDNQNEIEEFRLAYMVFIGCEVDAETVKKARQSGAFGVPKECDAKFLTKDINATFLDSHKKTLEGNIYKFAKGVNMGDENFSGGAMSGEARKWKLLALENKATAKERKNTLGLKRMFELIEEVWRVKGQTFDYTKLSFQYKRNIPIELKEVSEMSKNFKGIISDSTLLSLLPFITDVDAELKLIEEQQDIPNLDDVPGTQTDEEI